MPLARLRSAFDKWKPIDFIKINRMHHVQSLNWTRTCIRQRLPLPSIPTLGSFPCIPGVYWEKYWVSEPSPDPCLHSAADIRCHTSPSGGVHTYMHIPKYVLANTNPFITFPCHCRPLAMPPPCHGPQTHNIPGQPQYHTESRSGKPTFSWLSPTWVRNLTAGFAEGGALMREKQLP